MRVVPAPRRAAAGPGRVGRACLVVGPRARDGPPPRPPPRVPAVVVRVGRRLRVDVALRARAVPRPQAPVTLRALAPGARAPLAPRVVRRVTAEVAAPGAVAEGAVAVAADGPGRAPPAVGDPVLGVGPCCRGVPVPAGGAPVPGPAGVAGAPEDAPVGAAGEARPGSGAVGDVAEAVAPEAEAAPPRATGPPLPAGAADAEAEAEAEGPRPGLARAAPVVDPRKTRAAGERAEVADEVPVASGPWRAAAAGRVVTPALGGGERVRRARAAGGGPRGRQSGTAGPGPPARQDRWGRPGA